MNGSSSQKHGGTAFLVGMEASLMMEDPKGVVVPLSYPTLLGLYYSEPLRFRPKPPALEQLSHGDWERMTAQLADAVDELWDLSLTLPVILFLQLLIIGFYEAFRWPAPSTWTQFGLLFLLTIIYGALALILTRAKHQGNLVDTKIYAVCNELNKHLQNGFQVYYPVSNWNPLFRQRQVIVTDRPLKEIVVGPMTRYARMELAIETLAIAIATAYIIGMIEQMDED